MLDVANFGEIVKGEFRRIPLLGNRVNRAERKDSGFYTRNQALTAEHLPSAQLLSSPPSSPAGGLVDPYALPDDLLTPFCYVVPRVSSGPIRARATGDEVLAPIY